MPSEIVGLGAQSVTYRLREIANERNEKRVAERREEIKAKEADTQRRAQAWRAERSEAVHRRIESAFGASIDTRA